MNLEIESFIKNRLDYIDTVALEDVGATSVNYKDNLLTYVYSNVGYVTSVPSFSWFL